MKRSLTIFTIVCALAPAIALASPHYLKDFKRTYPAAKKLHSCNLCHLPDGNYVPNYFGQDYQKANYNFKAIEQLDSDGDTFKNIDEIKAETFPGDKNSFPAHASQEE